MLTHHSAHSSNKQCREGKHQSQISTFYPFPCRSKPNDQIKSQITCQTNDLLGTDCGSVAQQRPGDKNLSLFTLRKAYILVSTPSKVCFSFIHLLAQREEANLKEQAERTLFAQSTLPGEASNTLRLNIKNKGSIMYWFFKSITDPELRYGPACLRADLKANSSSKIGARKHEIEWPSLTSYCHQSLSNERERVEVKTFPYRIHPLF